jgi:DNA-binding CsgD family transcriptional regulator
VLKNGRRSINITDRQRQVIGLIAAGCSDREVGEILGIAERTARMHSNVIRNKLKVERRDQIPRGYFVLIGGSSLFEAFEFSVNAIDGRIPAPADSDG